MSGVVGMADGEVERHHHELRPIIETIMSEHTARKGCTWKPGAVAAILCDLAQAFERQEICVADVAA